MVSKTATVSLPDNGYHVDQTLCGRRVELPSDPYDPEVIEVHYGGRPFGHACPTRSAGTCIRRPKGPADQQRPVSESDCLRLICDEHEWDWLARRITYQFHDGGGGDGDHDDTTTRTARDGSVSEVIDVSLDQLQPSSVSADCRSLANWRRGLPIPGPSGGPRPDAVPDPPDRARADLR